MNNLKEGRTITDERLDECLKALATERVDDAYALNFGLKELRTALTELQHLRSQSLSTQQPMGEVTHSPPDVDNRPFCDCHQEYGEGLIEALQWYGEQARLCRLIHSEGDAGRYALSADGGKRAKVALHPNQESGE